MKFFGTLILVAALLSMNGLCQSVTRPGEKNGNNILATNECVAKGGIGIVNTHLYIDLNSDKNELILDGGNKWVGQSPETSELVFFFDNRVWSTAVVPREFDLSRAVVVSFEGKVVRFFDFGNTSGGYYRRPRA
jgi:hypothetical protein